MARKPFTAMRRYRTAPPGHPGRGIPMVGPDAGRFEEDRSRCPRYRALRVSSINSYLMRQRSLRSEDRRGKVLTVGCGERRRQPRLSLEGLQARLRGQTL